LRAIAGIPVASVTSADDDSLTRSKFAGRIAQCPFEPIDKSTVASAYQVLDTIKEQDHTIRIVTSTRLRNLLGEGIK
jgi:hypothetical protein